MIKQKWKCEAWVRGCILSLILVASCCVTVPYWLLAHRSPSQHLLFKLTYVLVAGLLCRLRYKISPKPFFVCTESLILVNEWDFRGCTSSVIAVALCNYTLLSLMHRWVSWAHLLVLSFSDETLEIPVSETLFNQYVALRWPTVSSCSGHFLDKYPARVSNVRGQKS